MVYLRYIQIGGDCVKIGAQLFTVRDFCRNLDDFAMTLKKIADIGYEYVQVSGTCEYEPEWLKEQLEANGLKCTLTHTPPQKIAKAPSEVAQGHKVFGCRYVGIGYYDIEKTGMEEFVSMFKPAAELLRQSGCRLLYHNHDIDFKRIEGLPILEQLINRFEPELLEITFDVYWVQAAGGDPIWWIKHLKGRAPCVHLKDMGYGRRMEPVGHGNMNIEGIVRACLETGVEYAFIEQDNCNGEDPFECLRKSFEYLKALSVV